MPTLRTILRFGQLCGGQVLGQYSTQPGVIFSPTSDNPARAYQYGRDMDWRYRAGYFRTYLTKRHIDVSQGPWGKEGVIVYPLGIVSPHVNGHV